MSVMKSFAPQWEIRNLKKYIADLFGDTKDVRKCNDSLSSFLFAMAELEAKLWEIHRSDRYRFDRIFDEGIVAKIENIVRQARDENFRLKRERSFERNGSGSFWDIVLSKKITFKNISELENHFYWPISILEPYQSWNCLLVTLYQAASGLSWFDTVRSLSQKLDLSINFSYTEPLMKNGTSCNLLRDNELLDFSMEGELWKRMVSKGSGYTFVIDPLLFFNSVEKFRIYNYEQIQENRTDAVFLTESLTVADLFQQKYTVDFVNFFEDSLKDCYEREAMIAKRSFENRLREVEKQLTLLRQEHRISDEHSAHDYNGPHWIRVKAIDLFKQKNDMRKTTAEWSQKISTTCSAINEFIANPAFSGYAAKHQNAQWTGWCGGFAYMGRYDWSCLADKKVFFVFTGQYSEHDRFRHMLRVCEALDAVKPAELIIVDLPEVTNLTDPTDNPFEIFSLEEALAAAHEREIEIPVSLKACLTKYLHKHGKGQSGKGYLIEPIIDKNKITLLTAVTNAGKSFLAHAIGYAFATGGKLFNDWNVQTCGKALCISDAEMDDNTLKNRKEKFTSMYPGDDNENFVIKSVAGWDLEKEEWQEKLQQEIEHATLEEGERGKPVQLLILDHLSALTKAGYQEENWKKLSSKLSELAKKNALAILLLHHDNRAKSGTYGSSFVENKVDVIIRLEKWPEITERTQIGMKVSVPKNRDRKDQPIPYPVILDLGKHPRWIENISDQLDWKMPREEKIKMIQQMRQTQTVQMIADAFNVAKVTVEKFLKSNGLTRGYRHSGKTDN